MPEIAARLALDGSGAINVAPTLLAILGVDRPGGLDGHVIADLVRSTA